MNSLLRILNTTSTFDHLTSSNLKSYDLLESVPFPISYSRKINSIVGKLLIF